MYTGQTWIPELGLYHYKARVYSPTLGRFLQTDPIGYGDGLNWYAYVGNDPLNKSDPTGMIQMECFCTVTYSGDAFAGSKAPSAAQQQSAQPGRNTKNTGPISVLGAGLVTIWNAGVHVWNAGVDARAAAQEASTTGARREDPYSVRVQVQGLGLAGGDRSINLLSKEPVKLREVHLALTALAIGLPKNEQRILGSAFVKASTWATSAAASGGVAPGASKSFGNGVDLEGWYRVDIHPLSGSTNIVP
ncbi:RHS repeat-associated core domain-containing protein [Caulobacter sp. Root655]|uniref:RHS repeat-associated core domain-containing protein n=1 Tax=Caulobacter sp. Root655 TaxID=1736578 RepID=UPI0009E837F6|nr:RHS repeat-associated core domain-containing protein [Caulobacter sp. Root655]